MKEQRICFDPFCLDLTNECLWRGTQAIKLRPKAFSVLAYLLERPGRLVTKEEVLNDVWPGTFVGEAVLKVAVRQIREALGDDPKSPAFIETAHRRGYRFIGQISGSGSSPAHDTHSSSYQDFVGRDEALERMRGWLSRMLQSERQIVFITGEAGIGKTALVDQFARSIASDRSIRIGRGQCLEQYGTSEAYLPVLEAIGRLCREQRGAVDVLRAHAPMWLLQMPSLISASDREVLRRELAGASRERMLREIGEALEVLATELPLVLILEDLHWSDYSTVDLISYLARQRQPAQLLVIGTYRPVELAVSAHPLKAVKRELIAKQQCEELPLEYLSRDAVERYLSSRFPANRFPPDLSDLIHDRTEGNPLFMVNVVDYLVVDRLIGRRNEIWDLLVEIENVDVGVPDSIKHMIEKQIDHLDPEGRRTLEAASVAGAEFSAPAAAAGLQEDRNIVEARFDELARRRQFIHDCGILLMPTGEAAGRYRFIHELYRHVLYERVSVPRRIELHRRIGAQAEVAYGGRVSEIAAELAMHFEKARNYARAAKYLQQAADNAIRRFAYRDAVALSRRGLELLVKVPESPERAEQELCLQLTLGVPLIATEGYAAPDVGRAYMKARELSQQLGETPDVSEVLWGLWAFHTLSADFATAREIANEFLRLAERLPYPGLALRGHWAMEITFMHLGEFASAMEHFWKALSLYDPEQHLEDAFLYAQNPGVAMRCFAGWALWLLGRPDQALHVIGEALTFAHELSEPHGLAHAFFFASILHQLRREERLAQEYAEAAIAVSREHGLLLYEAMSSIAQGWALTQQKVEVEEAIEQMQRGLAAHRATGSEVLRPHFLALLAEALSKANRTAEGLELIAEAIDQGNRNGEQYYHAELYRLQAELILQRPSRKAASNSATGGTSHLESDVPASIGAEACFARSLEVARRQNAKSFELRTATSMARMYKNSLRTQEARDLLASVCESFSEGFETRDFFEAKALLDQLS